MLRDKGSPVQVVLYEGVGSTELSEEARFEVMSILLDKGYAVARSGQGARSGRGDDEPLLVLGDFGGEAPALEDERGVVFATKVAYAACRNKLTLLKRVARHATVSGCPACRISPSCSATIEMASSQDNRTHWFAPRSPIRFIGKGMRVGPYSFWSPEAHRLQMPPWLVG